MTRSRISDEGRFRVEDHQGQHEDGVEVQAAEVGAQPPGPGQPVGIGDVGEERGPDHVDADPDLAGPRAAVPAQGRVPALVEHCRDQGQAEHDEQVHRVAQGLLEPAAQPVDGERPPVQGRQGGDHGHHDGPPEQRRQQHQAAFAARSDSSVPRARRASSGLAVGAAGGASPPATIPSGSSLAVIR